MRSWFGFSKQRPLQRQVIVASDSLIKTYYKTSQSSSSTQKPIIIYNINDTLPYLADFDEQKRVLEITAKQFLSGTFDNRIHIFFITNATQDNINDIMGKIQETNGNISECFVIVEKEDELAQIQQHQQYVQEQSSSENTTSLQSDIDDNISNLKKLAPKTLEQFGKQELKEPNNYFLISKGLPQHIRKFYKDIYQIKNCSPVENFFKGKVENVFTEHTTDSDTTVEAVLTRQVNQMSEKSLVKLQIEQNTADKYYIIPLCNIHVEETQNVVDSTLISTLQNQTPLISKILLTTASGGRNICSVGISFLQYFTMYQLFFDVDFQNLLNKVLEGIKVRPPERDIKNYFNNISLATKMLEGLVSVSTLYNRFPGQNENIDDNNIEMFRFPIEAILNELKELQRIYDQFDVPSKELLREKISYAKMLKSIHDIERSN